MGNGLIIIVLVAVGLYVFKSISKRKSNKDTAQLHNELQSNLKLNRDEKLKILAELKDIRNVHLEDLINYEITLLSQTKLDNQDIEEKISQKYPKTFSRMSFNFTPLYKEYDVALVDESIVEMLDSLGAKEFDSERNQPFLRFEYYIKKEAKEKALKLFYDFVKQN